MRTLITSVIGILLYSSIFSVFEFNLVHSKAIYPIVIDTEWEKTSNLRVDESYCQSLAPTDSYWIWVPNAWDGGSSDVYGQPIPDYVPEYWSFIPCLEGCDIPTPATHQWFRTTLNLPTLEGIEAIELIGYFKQQYGGIITVNDNIFVFVNPDFMPGISTSLDDVVGYGGTAGTEDWIGFPEALVERLPYSPLHCNCIWDNHDNMVYKGSIAPETEWYIDPLELPVTKFHPGDNVVYVLLEEYCRFGGLGHLAFRINAPQNLGFTWTAQGKGWLPTGGWQITGFPGLATAIKGEIVTYTANYNISANVDLTNVKVQGGIGSKATNIWIYFDDMLVDSMSSLTSKTWYIPAGTLKLGVSKSNNVFTLTLTSMSKGESHMLSIIFDWTYKSLGIQNITSPWSAVSTSMFGSLKTPYTSVITVAALQYP